MTIYFTNKLNIKSLHRPHQWLILTVFMLLSACSEKMANASIEGYNHMPYWSIAGFSVNGEVGSNISPQEGGENLLHSTAREMAPRFAGEDRMAL